jgi:site-specific recombinase XerC
VSYAERTNRPPRTLTDRETAQILKTMGAAKSGFRDRVIVSLALGCGLRQSEIVALDVHDVAQADGLKPKRTIQLRVFKRAAANARPEDQRVQVPDSTYYLLEKYLRGEWKDRQQSTGTPLFVARTGKRLSTRRVREMFLEWQQRARLDQPISFHGLRHTAISNVRRKTGDIRIAQKVARHVNIATTVRYEHASDEEVARAIKDLPA